MTVDGAGLVVSPGYPPEHHVLRNLAFEVQHAPHESRAWMPVTDYVCNAAGRVHTGLISVLVDAVCGGLAAVTAAPDGWIATADLTLHLARPAVAAELEAVARVRRAGRTTIVLEADVFDAAAPQRSPLAVATLTFSVLPRRDGNPVMTPLAAPDGDAGTDSDSGAIAPARQPFIGPAGGFAYDAYDACGFVDHGGGVVELMPSEYVRNSLGGVQGGVLGALVDAATVSALGPGFELVDLHLVYLALARAGPIRASASVPSTSVSSTGSDYAESAVEVQDVGAARRTTVARTVGVRW